jgi:hypothetical protein
VLQADGGHLPAYDPAASTERTEETPICRRTC